MIATVPNYLGGILKRSISAKVTGEKRQYKPKRKHSKKLQKFEDAKMYELLENVFFLST